MKKLIAALPAWVEFVIVIGIAFGNFMLSSISSLFHPEWLARPHHNDGSLIWLGIIEVAIMIVLGLFLWARHWTPARLGLVPQMHDAAWGIGLAATCYAAYIASWILFAVTFPNAAQSAANVVVIGPGVELATALIVPWVNAVFEEVFVAGYVISLLKPARGMWFAMNVSIAIRLVYHLYQGALGVIVVIPLGLIFSYWFARTGRLWPLIVAHALIDLIGTLASMNATPG